MRLRSVLASITVMLTIIAVNLGTSPAAQAAPPGISITDVSVTETNAGTVSAVFALSYGGAPTAGVTVDYATGDGTATAGSDYVAASGTATLSSTGCKCGTITIQVNGDTAFENNETFFVNLSNAVNKPLDDAQGIGTITNDDFPTASVDDPTAGESAGTMTFTVSLDQSAPFNSVIGYSTSAGTATAGSDYTTASGNLTILSGATSGTVNVPVLDDAIYEGNETLSLNLTSVSNVIIGDAQGTGTITDDDPQPAITVDDPVAAENAGTMTFTISLDAAAGVPVSVDYATSDNTATAGQDYTATSGTATILAGSTTTTVDVPVLDDAVYEGDETLNLDLSGEVGGTLSDSQGQGTITEDDATPAISVDSPAAGEGDGTLTFTISIDAAAAVNTSVDFATADGTAADGADYTAQFGTATILAGSTSTTVDVPVLDDSLYEGDETLSLDLSNPVNGTGTPSGTGTITDDESAPAISVDSPSAAEGAGTLTFTVSIDAVSALDTSVDYATADGTASAGADYTATSGTATILAGATSATVDVTVLEDSVYEGDETLSLDLSNPVNATGTPSGSGTITENDAAPTISIDDPTVGEAAGTMTFTISLDAAADVATSVDYDTANGTATAGADYTAQSGSATILAGSTSTTVDVAILDDAVDEPNETLSLDLSNAVNGLGTPSGTGTITDDDATPPSFDISIDDANVAEGNAGSHPLAFTVTLSAASGSDVSVDYATSNGTATAGSDYVAKSGTLVLPAGTTTKTVNVTVKGDTVWEPNETFTVTLSNQTDGTLLDPTATGRITNDDKQPSALTVKAGKTPTTVKARGLLEPASVGNKVVVTLAQRSHGRWHTVASKTVGVRKFADRDGDGKTDARYSAGFARAGRHGSFRFTVRFAGDANTRPCSAKVRFRL
jgi:hypothetical protein